MNDALKSQDRFRGNSSDDCHGNRLAWKRALDLSLIILSAPVTIPLAAVIALLIKLVSRGPALFCQQRVGLHGQTFMCLKFRTMKVNADTGVHRNYLHELIGSDAPMKKMDVKGDSRLILFGAILRATGLDELPQLINVLRGEMSLVGPRPCLPYEAEKYSDWHKRRFEALPGLTGWWQVCGKNNTSFNEMIQMDIWYAENQSLRLDLKIILFTVPALLSQVLEVRQTNRNLPSRPVEKAL
jgi:lipopolysaccharide/colanic/teichoic acid biosynthesis glycosyltransferase